jgi:hypothetical protein
MLPSLGDWKGTSILVNLQSVVQVTASQPCVENSTIKPYQWVEKELLEGPPILGSTSHKIEPPTAQTHASVN